MADSKTIWFPAKTYGWGWGMPCAWQGWLVLAGYAGAMVVTALYFPPAQNGLAFALCTGLATAALLLICWFKGEKPGWRWG